MNRVKFCFAFVLICFSALSLCGCFMPRAHSMGASLMAVPHQPRVSADSSNAEMSVAVGAFGNIAGEGLNVNKVKTGGGDVSFMYRMGGAVSPLFFSAAAGGMLGKLRFDCNESRCSDNAETYKAWLKTKEGKRDYSFWDMQERLLLGGDFNVGQYVLLGLGGGVQFFQGSGSYDDKRDELEDQKLLKNIDENTGFAPVSSVWAGSRLGHGGEWGSVLAEFDMLYKSGIEDWTSAIMLNYFHTTGFYGGIVWNSQLGYGLNLGKVFAF